MKLTRQTGIAIAATLAVILIAVAIFSTAAQPMSDEAATAQAWVNALCANQFDDLYALSAVPDGVDKATFQQQAKAYLSAGNIPQPCAGQVNFNLVRNLAIPKSMTARYDRVRFFSGIMLNDTDSTQSFETELWLYHEIGGQWRVWASFLSVTLEQPVAAGKAASLLNSNGVLLGTIQIDAPVLTYQADDQVLIGIPVEWFVQASPWEEYEAQLFINQQRAKTVDNGDLLPEEWRHDFLPPIGSYIPQNLHQTGMLWFSAPTLAKPVNLAFTVRVPYSGALQAAYLDVPVDTATPATPFNPFKQAKFVAIDRDNPTFEVQIDTAGSPIDRLSIICGDFVLITVSDEWKRGTDCSFTQGGLQDFLPGEKMRATVTFAGYNLPDATQLKSLTYRRSEVTPLIPYTLWQKDASPG